MILTIKPYLHLNCVLMLNWIIWNRIFLTLELYLHETELFNLELFWHFAVCNRNLYLYLTELELQSVAISHLWKAMSAYA